MLVYILGRLRIPKLRFDGFFKSDSSEIGTSGQIDMRKFFIKVMNVNRRSEGKAKLCMGFITIDNKTYEMLWEDDYRGNTFGKEALLQVFYLDRNRNTINFITYQKQQETIIPKSYDECIHNNRGQCPKPLTERIENIINHATRV